MGDADDSYDFSNLLPFLEKLRENYDLVMGNRFKGGIKEGAMPFLNKYLGNPVLSFLGRVFYNNQIGDFHCGLRGFKRDAITRLDLQAMGMEFASEMIIKATLHKLKIAEVPTTLSPDGRSRRPHLRPWRDGWRHLRLLLLLSPRWLFLYPGFLLLLFGCGIMSLLFDAPVKINKYIFDIHTMLFGSAFTLIGLQSILFFAFSRWMTTFDVKVISPLRFPRLLKLFTLERGLMVGMGLVLLGCSGAGYTFLTWVHHQFGPLIPTDEMRVLIPSMTFLLAGMEIIFSSFFLGILDIHIKPSAK